MVKHFDNFIIEFEFIVDRYEIKDILPKPGKLMIDVLKELELILASDILENLNKASKIN